MSSLAEHVERKALRLGVPLRVHLDLTWRCNLRCVHCYIGRRETPELSLGELRRLLEELAACGTLSLCLSGGEPLLRDDFYEIVQHARALAFDVSVKTNAVLLDEAGARRLARAHVSEVHVSVYSHRAEAHDAVTRVPGSLERTLAAVRMLVAAGVRTRITNVLVGDAAADFREVRRLATELGAAYALDPSVTPRLDGDRSVVSLGAPAPLLEQIFADEELAGPRQEHCPPSAPDEALDSLPCSAGHTSCYISPSGDVYPCVQFPLRAGNVREQAFREIWRDSAILRELRAVTMADLPACRACPVVAACTRCPGLAFMEGDLRGPSPLDGEKVFLRTGVRPPCLGG